MYNHSHSSLVMRLDCYPFSADSKYFGESRSVPSASIGADAQATESLPRGSCKDLVEKAKSF